MKKIMLSVRFGASLAPIFRTREIAKALVHDGYNVAYVVPRAEKSAPLLTGFLAPRQLHFTEQNYSSFDIIHGKVDALAQYARHIRSEYDIYRRYQPDILIGDGFHACAYKPDVPFLRILNRCDVEIGTDIDSPYTDHEQQVLTGQIEELFNAGRRAAGIQEQFHYREAISPPVMLHGASYFVDDISLPYLFGGIWNTLQAKSPQGHAPDPDVCFVGFGTGLSLHEAQTLSRILRQIEPHFNRIYVNYGTLIPEHQLYHPANAVMKPIFHEFPEHIGAMICHGGVGILHIGARLGVPVIAVPLTIEQYSNAYKMEQLGVAVNAGYYDAELFEGMRQKMEVNWEVFDNALAHMRSIRTVGSLEDRFDSGNNRFVEEIKRFIRQQS